MDPNEQADADFARIRKVVEDLSEHFETVQIFTTNFDTEVGTTSLNFGSGNWHARRGQVREWSLRKDEGARVEVRRVEEED